MKKIKYLTLTLILVLTLAITNVNAATGQTPSTITTKEKLLYYIYYYGGEATITGNTIKLTKDLELNQNITFGNNENIILDLNGHKINLGNGQIKILESAKNIKITDTSKTNNDYIKGTSDYTIYNASKNGNLTIESTTLQGNKTVIYSLQNSTTTINNSDIEIPSTTGENAIKVTNGTITLNNTKINITSSTNCIGLTLTDQNSKAIINSGQFILKNIAINNEKGTLIVNDGKFLSTNNYALKTNSNTTINGGSFYSNSTSGIQITNNANVLLNHLFASSSNNSAINIPQNQTINKYIAKTSTLTQESNKQIAIMSNPKSKSLKQATFTYDGKVKNPNVTITNYLNKKLTPGTDYKLVYQSGRKNVGNYFIQIIYLNNYKYLTPETLHFKINPKSTYITNLTRGKKTITLKLKKQTIQTTGYQITYSQNKNFKNSKIINIKNTNTKRTIKNLKSNKRYYIKVRTYKTIYGKMYYSTWSQAKSIIVK